MVGSQLVVQYNVQITLKYEDSLCGLSNCPSTHQRAEPNALACLVPLRAKRQNVPNVKSCQTSQRAKRPKVPNVPTFQTCLRAKRPYVPNVPTCQSPDVPFRPHPKAPSAGSSHITMQLMQGVPTCQASPRNRRTTSKQHSYSTRFWIPTYHKARRQSVLTPHITSERHTCRVVPRAKCPSVPNAPACLAFLIWYFHEMLK